MLDIFINDKMSKLLIKNFGKLAKFTISKSDQNLENKI